ncbi:hypothetical protein GCM10009827_075710 [Dactylosporangium maewongense]|uniref:Uncharacterized protein n=1 Tax=Dactylosporangium maewongense TaxID=634393 RepID=A0ABP4MHY5_9ACTN
MATTAPPRRRARGVTVRRAAGARLAAAREVEAEVERPVEATAVRFAGVVRLDGVLDPPRALGVPPRPA